MDNELSVVSKMNADFYVIFWRALFKFNFGYKCGILEADRNLSDILLCLKKFK